ncbi:MAG: acyltransferase family protein [Muribaculaceae bacterium]
MSQIQQINTDSKPHYALLDGLRGVAALLVVWYHIFEGYQFAGQKPIIDFANHGYLAVDFFFILSGFVVGYAYDSRWGKTLTLGGFFKRRIIRLHPMVVMGALIGAVSFALSGFARWDGSESTVTMVLVALLCASFMIPALPGQMREVRGNGEMFPLNGPCWSLFFEYIGNIVYALVLRRLGTRVLMMITVALGAALAWFAVGDVSQYGCIGVGWTVDEVNLYGGALRMLFPFTMGMLLSRLFKKSREVKGIFWLCTLALVVLLHVPYIASNGSVCLNGVFEMLCIMIVFPAIVWYAASGTTTDRFSTNACAFLGNLSYPLYMVHYPVMYLFYMWLIDTKQYTFGETWQVAFLVYAVSLVLAWLCMRFYDIPLRRWLTKISNKK